MIVWDEKKRQANLIKHKLDFEDARIVYESLTKATFRSFQNSEERNVDIDLVAYLGSILALVYTKRGQDVRIISFRAASRKERRFYAKARESD